MTATQSRLSEVGEAISQAYTNLKLDPQYKPNAKKTFELRYSRKNAAGEPSESAREAHWRLALNVASVEVLYASGADWVDGDEEPAEVNALELEFPYRTVARQYNWLLRHGRKLKTFEVVVANGLDQWLDKAQRYYNELLAPLVFVNNSPTWTGAGTPLGQLAACFVLPINDALVAGESNIMQTLRDAVAIQQTGGGNGFSFGRLRPAGSRVSKSMGEATGVVGFLRLYNSTFDEIRQGGSRRGANMGVCPVWHPDVLSFIEAKTEEGENANFNISVALTDKFMEAVKADDDWQLHFPGPDGPVVSVQWRGERVTKLPARELFDKIVTNAHMLGDPGALFIDAANRENPCPAWYYLESTNPCGEQWLGPYENCCLGSIAVQQFVRSDRTFDWEAFRAAIELSTEMLDDVVDANAYVASVPQLEEAAQGGRRIGLGQMGVADALALMGLRYGSTDGLEFASQLTEFLRYHALKTSVRLAAERGPFPRIEESIYDRAVLIAQGNGARYQGIMKDGVTPYTGITWSAPAPLVEHVTNWDRPELSWDELTDEIVSNGVRNSCQTTFAPTGTIATVAGVEGYGCEPFFALAYKRTVMQEGQDIVLSYASDLFDQALRAAGLDDAAVSAVAEAVQGNGGSCQGVAGVPDEIQRVFVTAGDLTGEEHVSMQAVLQAFVDNSISKTINFSNEATVEDVLGVYWKAWETGCKGITIYRQNSRKREVLTTNQASPTGQIEVVDEDHWPIVKALPIPPEAETDGMPSRTYTVRTPFGKVRATITSLSDRPDRPFDIELGIGRGGSDVNAFTEALGRLASLLMRAGVDPRDIADQLIGIGGLTREETLRPDKAMSVPDAVGKLILRDHDKRQLAPAEPFSDAFLVAAAAVVADHAADPNALCPKCGQFTMARVEGCMTCLPPNGCGYSKCGG